MPGNRDQHVVLADHRLGLVAPPPPRSRRRLPVLRLRNRSRLRRLPPSRSSSFRPSLLRPPSGRGRPAARGCPVARGRPAARGCAAGPAAPAGPGRPGHGRPGRAARGRAGWPRGPGRHWPRAAARLRRRGEDRTGAAGPRAGHRRPAGHRRAASRLPLALAAPPLARAAEAPSIFVASHCRCRGAADAARWHADPVADAPSRVVLVPPSPGCVDVCDSMASCSKVRSAPAPAGAPRWTELSEVLIWRPLARCPGLDRAEALAVLPAGLASPAPRLAASPRSPR